MIPSSDRFDQSTIASLLEVDPLVAEYRAFFSLFDWSVVDDWLAQRSPFFGSHGHPLSTYVKVALLRIKQGLIFATQLHDFLLKHPLLVIELGFDLHLDPHAPYGFDVAHTLPTRFWLGKKLRLLDNDLLQDLLAALVAALQAEIPGLGETVAFDVKHIFAWVRENNPQISVKGPYNVSHIPQGDPDCRLGVKKSSNQEQPDGSTKTKKVALFGYGSGVAAATDPVYGDIVLAEYTLPFNEADVTYFRPLFQRTQLAVNQLPASVVSPCLPASMTTNPLPTSVTADAAYDVWYVYETVAHGPGIAAVPLNSHGHEIVPRDPDGTPRCSRGLRMHPAFFFRHPKGYRAQRFRCPLLFPEKTEQTCDHEQFAKAKGCVKDLNWEQGGLMRAMLDRDGPFFHALYHQRTACERINSQAQALGIERPKVRNIHSVRNLNTLIYLVINAKALVKAKSINQGLLQIR